MIGNRNIRRGLMAVLMAVAMVFSRWSDVGMKRMLTMLKAVVTALMCEATSRPMSAESSCTTAEPLHASTSTPTRGEAVFPAIGTMLAVRTGKRNNEKEQK